MTVRHVEKEFNYGDEIDEPETPIKCIKSNRTKFIKDLNYRSLAQLRSEISTKCFENSKDKQYVFKRQRQKINSQNPLATLLEKVIPNARIIKAQWKQNKLHGNVQIQYNNGNIFIGKYQNSVRVQGKLTYYEQKCTYQGYFFGQKFSGIGKLSYEGGRIIEGEWDNMQIVGNATITYPNKDVYYGPVNKRLFKHGEGYLFLHNGYKYIGQFEDGSINGMGSYFKEDKLIKKGLWQKGRLIRQFENSQQQLLTEQSCQSSVIKSLNKKFSYRFNDDQKESSNNGNSQTQQFCLQKLSKQQESSVN